MPLNVGDSVIDDNDDFTLTTGEKIEDGFMDVIDPLKIGERNRNRLIDKYNRLRDQYFTLHGELQDLGGFSNETMNSWGFPTPQPKLLGSGGGGGGGGGEWPVLVLPPPPQAPSETETKEQQRLVNRATDYRNQFNIQSGVDEIESLPSTVDIANLRIQNALGPTFDELEVQQ